MADFLGFNMGKNAYYAEKCKINLHTCKIFCTFAAKLKRIGMARPIKETPILFGDEARRFEMQMLNPSPISAEQKARMLSDYEFLRSRCVNCAF